MKLTARLLVPSAALLVLLVACGGEPAPKGIHATTTSAPVPQASFVGGTTQVSTAPTMPGYLTNIDATSDGQTDKITFTFSNLLPGYRIGPVTGPFTADGSGDPVVVVGPDYLEAFFTGAGYNSGGAGNQTYNGPLAIPAPSNAVVMTEMKRTGDFEAHLGWVIGTSAPAQFTVTTLAAPIRVVVEMAPQ